MILNFYFENIIILHCILNESHTKGYLKALNSLFLRSFSCICLRLFFISCLGIFYFYILHKKKVLESWKFQFLMNLHVLGCPEQEFTIFTKCLIVCLYVTQFLWPCYREKLIGGIEWNFRFSCILLWPYVD